MQAARSDGGVDTPEGANDLKLSLFKLLCLNVMHSAGYVQLKVQVFERLVNPEGEKQIFWSDKKVIDAVNFIVFMSTIMIKQVDSQHLQAQREGGETPKIDELDDDQIYKASLFANVYALVVQEVFSGRLQVDRQVFIFELITKTAWLLDPLYLRKKISEMTASAD